MMRAFIIWATHAALAPSNTQKPPTRPGSKSFLIFRLSRIFHYHRSLKQEREVRWASDRTIRIFTEKNSGRTSVRLQANLMIWLRKSEEDVLSTEDGARSRAPGGRSGPGGGEAPRAPQGASRAAPGRDDNVRSARHRIKRTFENNEC